MRHNFEKSELVELFSAFLDRNGALEKYKDAFRRKNRGEAQGTVCPVVAVIDDIYERGINIKFIVDRSFNWTVTDQGHNYWAQLDHLWYDEVDSLIAGHTPSYDSIW